MNIQHTIIAGIRELLFVNDYLVLPGFGGFVLKSRSAHYSVSGTMLMPACKPVSFNSQLRQNDGVLVLWLQARLACGAGEALTHLNDFTQFCTSILQAKRRLSLNGIGFFYLDFENNVCFEPQVDANFLKESFGLTPVILKELPQRNDKAVSEKVFTNRTVANVKASETPVLPAGKKRNYTRYTAVVLLTAFILGVTSLLVINMGTSGLLRSALFNSADKRRYAPTAYELLKINVSSIGFSDYVTDANGIALINLDDEKNVAVRIFDTKPISKAIKTTKPFSSTSKLYEVVLGCFLLVDNANRLVKQLTLANLPAGISGKNHNGLTVVSIGSFKTKIEAMEKLSEIKHNFPTAWIKQMK